MSPHRPNQTVVLGLLGPNLDAGSGPGRWESWRPSVALCQHDDFLVDRLELLYQEKHAPVGRVVDEDVRSVSPETTVRHHNIEFGNPWDFEEVYGALHDFAGDYTFDPESEDYFVHITTGTHVAQICLFLLTESRHFPAKLLQASPPKRRKDSSAGSLSIIDLDLSRYDRIATRFAAEQQEAQSFLKSGIETRNAAFNRLIDEIERVAIHSKEPILLMGPTGAGKSQLARRIFELKQNRRQVEGRFVEVNCATLRGDAAMSTLFGHVKGSFTGATTDRPGLLKAASGGILFLDEIGELGIDEQTMLLRAIEEKRFLPLGSDAESDSEFQLIAGTNRDLRRQVAAGEFRDDLLARINLWTFVLPGLAQRIEDLEPNLDYELRRVAASSGKNVTFNREAREAFLSFATSPAARWSANFRDLGSAVTRMSTLAPDGRIRVDTVAAEIDRLSASWSDARSNRQSGDAVVVHVLGADRAAELDRFERVQLADVLEVCRQSRTLSEAGRVLFAKSRARKARPNDADRLRKYLARFGLAWQDVRHTSSPES